MANSELPPLPTPEDYTRAMRYMNSDFFYMLHPIRAITNRLDYLEGHDPQLKDQVKEEVTNVANLFFPLDLSTGQPIPEGINIVTNAAHGLYTGLFVAEDMHKGLISHLGILNEGAQVEVEDTPNRIKYLNSIAEAVARKGAEGLAMIGDRNRRFVEAWGREFAIGSSEDVKSYYALGFGFAAISAFELHAAILGEVSSMNDPHFGTNL
jgi:hypothetical protein